MSFKLSMSSATVYQGIALVCPGLDTPMMIFNGITWYYMLIHGILHGILHGNTWYSMIFNGITWYSMVIHGIQW